MIALENSELLGSFNTKCLRLWYILRGSESTGESILYSLYTNLYAQVHTPNVTLQRRGLHITLHVLDTKCCHYLVDDWFPSQANKSKN